MKIDKRNGIYRLQVVTVKMSSRDFELLADLIYEGGTLVAQQEYEWVTPQFDEDAGVFTDYGENSAARTWANVYFTQLLQSALLQSDFPDRTDENENPEGEVMFLAIAVSSVIHFLSRMDDATQRKIWMQQGGSNYDSDGHYGLQTRDAYVQEWVERRMLNSKRRKAIIEALNGDFPRPVIETVTANLKKQEA